MLCFRDMFGRIEEKGLIYSRLVLLSQSEMQNALLARFLRWSPVALHRNEGVFAKRQNTCGKEKQSENEKKSARPAMNMNIFMSSSTNHKL